MSKLSNEEDINAATIAFEAYYTALGKVAHSWNHMQEELGFLFCNVTGLNNVTGMTIWHSLRSDLAQRSMLRAVVEQKIADDGWAKRFPRATEIVELIKAINTFSDRRNAAIHAPCSISIEAPDFELLPFTFFGNPNAQKLIGKDILAEFDWYVRTANVCRLYISQLNAALLVPRSAWPDKPHMPHRGEKNGPLDRQSPPKGH